jgi:CheY-like chemotaxis protein
MDAAASAYTVLVVDDQASVRDVLVMLVGLEDELVLAGTAENGLQAVALLGGACPDAVICDARMPVMGGLEAIPILREACPASVLVLYSSDPDASEQALHVGADAVFDKALDPGHVVDEVLRLCRGRRFGDAPER